MGPEIHHGRPGDAFRDYPRGQLPRYQAIAVCQSLPLALSMVNSISCAGSDVGCKTVANMIKGKTPEEIRKLFNIVNDFTPEEEVRALRSFVRHTLTQPCVFTGSDQEGERVGRGSLNAPFLYTSCSVMLCIPCMFSFPAPVYYTQENKRFCGLL